jgi:osmotically-inducible protein OsmY
MKPVLAFTCLIVAAASIPAVSYAANEADPPQVSAQALAAQNSPIAAKIQADMAAQNVASLTGITVSADSSGVVSLTGSALSQDDLDKVVSIAKNTTGVTAVNNSVKIQPK